MHFQDRNDLLLPGYLPLETGVQRHADGSVTVAALTRMPRCRARMVDWWFGWLGGTEPYRLWHPRDHIASDWQDRTPGRYIGAKHLVQETLGGGEVHHLRIHFRDPRELFDPAGYEALDAIAICARAGRSDKPVNTGHMTHFVRNTDVGCEMRTRFWFGDVHHQDPDIDLPDAVKAMVRRDSLTDDFCHRLLQHAIEEMGYLADLLPMLYRQATGDASF